MRYLPRRRRWTRVFFNSLRCFFFAMRLRRFLMTEPTKSLTYRSRKVPAYRAERGSRSSGGARGHQRARTLARKRLRQPSGDSPTTPGSVRGRNRNVDQPQPSSRKAETGP